MRYANLFRDEFHSSRVWQRTTWLGIPVQKMPLDLWRYQELIVELRPDILVETGTLYGGSALFFASVMDCLGHGRVVTVDPEPQREVRHPRVAQLYVCSVEGFDRVQASIPEGSSVMASLDSRHEPAHVERELELYSQLVTPGQALVLEDTHPYPLGSGVNHLQQSVLPSFRDRHPEFECIEESAKFGATFNPDGWLRKRAV
jgi:cephalosporin hydroxylase